MKNENSGHPSPPTPRGQHRTLKIISWILIVTAGLVLLIFFGTPLYLSSSGGTNLLVGKINSAVDGQVQMDDFSVGWFQGVKLTNLSYSDSGGNTSVTVERIETQPKYMSLLGGKVKLGKTIIDRPKVYLKVPPVTEMPTAETETRPDPSSRRAGLPIDQIDLQVIDGDARIEVIGQPAQTVHFANIASNIRIAEAGKPSSVDVSMNVDQGQLSAKGTITPAETGWTIADGDFEVTVSKLQLESLGPLFALAGKPMDMAGQLNVDATVQVQDGTVQRLKADATITEFAQGRGEQRRVFEKPVELSVLLVGSGETVKIENATVKSSFCTVACAGTLQSLTYDIDADLAQTQQFAGQFADMQDLSVAGQLAASGKVNLSDERIGVSGTGTAKGLTVQKDTVTTPVTDVELSFDAAMETAANQFRLSSAKLSGTPGTVTVSDVVLPLSETAAKTISLDAKAQLDIAKTWPFVQVLADVPKDIRIAGMMNSDVKVITEGSTIQLVTENTRINGLKITQPGAEPFVQEKVTLDGDIVLDTEAQRIDIRRLNLEAAEGQSLIKITKGQVQKKVSQNTTRLSGEVEAAYDLKALSAMASPFLPAGLVLEGQRTDTVKFDSHYPTDQPELMKANLNANGTFGFSKAQYMGLNIASTEMKLTIVDGLMDFVIPETTVNEGKMQLAGTMNLKEQPPFFRLKQPMAILQNVQVNDTLTRHLLLYMNPVFADAVRTSGVASFSCRSLAIPLSKEHLDKMDIQGTFGIESLKLQAGDFLGQLLNLVNTRDTAMLTIHPTDFAVQNGFVSYRDMQLDVGKTPIHFSGKIGLDQSLAMTVAVPISDRTLPLPLSGTLTKPQLDTGKLPQQLIEQEIRRGLERLFD